jgi:hypothetical protein
MELVSIALVPNFRFYLQNGQVTKEFSKWDMHPRGGSVEVLKGLSHGIVKGRAHLANQLALAVWPGTVGQQHNRNPCIKIDPKRTAAIPKMPYGAWGKMTPR